MELPSTKFALCVLRDKWEISLSVQIGSLVRHKFTNIIPGNYHNYFILALALSEANVCWT